MPRSSITLRRLRRAALGAAALSGLAFGAASARQAEQQAGPQAEPSRLHRDRTRLPES